jgi:hypothetical protein
VCDVGKLNDRPIADKRAKTGNTVCQNETMRELRRS